MVIRFKGKIVPGCGGHSNLGIPGKSSLANAPDDWPKVLYPGSLNVEIFLEELPQELDFLGPGDLIKKLDNGILKPAFMIAQKEISNNTIGPNCRVKGRGDAQIWRAIIEVEKSKEIYNCWVLRRLDSGMTRHIEVVADKYLRKALNLEDGDRVLVIIEGII
jgi:hypothetical protein